MRQMRLHAGSGLRPTVQQEAAVEFKNEKGESFARVRSAVTSIEDEVETHIGDST
ncbi:hypothetical protein JKG47_09215 [Acidithiobacillus sp. MC6.1]|nr:hypothetical protein [Acidithiobacillus sp. MC6.1]